MFAPTRYLEWARRFYGQVRFDLATSGVATVPLAELGVPAAQALDNPSGWARLRTAIAHHNNVPEPEAIAAMGTTHALWLAYATLTSPGDEVVVEAPVYEPLVRIAEGLGLGVSTFERAAADAYALDVERVARAMTPRTRVIAVTNLHNPTGARASDDALRALAGLAESRGATLLVDEVYAPFDGLTDDAGVFRDSARKLAPGIVVVSSLTKCYGLSPQRIGWMLGPAAVVARAGDTITASAGMLPLPHAHLAVHAFGRVRDLAARTRASLPGKRERVAAWVAAQGLAWSSPAAGLFGFVRVPGAGNLQRLVERGAREREVLVAPGGFFGAPDGFRLSWASRAEVLEEGLGRLAEVLRGRAS